MTDKAITKLIEDLETALVAGPYDGPWDVEEYQHEGRPLGRIMSDGGTIVAEIAGYIDSCGNGENARYIAACSPDRIRTLLDHLRALALTAQGKAEVEVEPRIPVSYEMIERLMAAVEGELDGLAIDAGEAMALLSYTLSGDVPASTAPPSAKRGEVEVKALEWEYVERPSMTYTAYWFDGDVAYYIDQGFGSDSYYFRTVRWPEETLYDGDDLSSAQSAAQADYERRIRSALHTSPVEKAETVEGAAWGATCELCAGTGMAGPDARPCPCGSRWETATPPSPETHVVPSIERLADLIDDAAPGILRPDTRLQIASRLRAALATTEGSDNG